MQTSTKLEKMYNPKKPYHLSPKEQEELATRQRHKGKLHKTKRGSRHEWEAY